MSSPSDELQKAIYDALVADAGVGALVGDRIYDGRPSDSTFPCITFGPADSITENLECLTARTDTVQLDIWSRDQGRLRPCKAICDAVKSALHEAGLDLVVNKLIQIRITRMNVFLDRDGVTAHGVVVVTADIEEGVEEA